MIYNAVAKLSKPATKEAQTTFLEALRSEMRGYEREVLKLSTVREYLYQLYNDKIRSGHAIAPLSRDFNKSKKGGAAELARRIEIRTKAAWALEHSSSDNAAEQLQHIRFDYELLMGDAIMELVQAHPLNGLAMARYGNIETLRETLFGTAVKLAVTIAVEQRATLSGEVVQLVDLFQQAAIELDRAIRKYVPRDSENPVRAFTSYISKTMRHNVSHYIAEQSRTVAIPRTVIDRSGPVLRAVKEGYADYDDLAVRSTQIIAARRDRKVPVKEVYTADEVHELISVMQESDSLDAEVATDENGQPATLGDRIEDPSPSPEQEYDRAHTGKRLMSIVRDYCSPTEYAVMELRWGMGKVRGLKDTADLFRETVNRPMNKTRVALIEAEVLVRLREGAENGDERLGEIRAVLEEI
jgi:DNA-directed RNA polymerase sigma subunit (sigma70/sigma32)